MDPRDKAIAGACRSILQTSALLRKELDKVLTVAGLTGPQFGILIQLDSYGSMPLHELGERLWVSCGNVTGLVDKLDASGYVRRIRLDSDRRVILAELTEKGREMMRELRPLHSNCLANFASGLSVDELLHLQELLEKIHLPCSNRVYPSTKPGGS